MELVHPPALTPTHLNGVHIVCYHHQLSLLLLHQCGDVVDAVLDGDRLLPRRHLPSLALLHGHRSQTLALLDPGLGAILVQQLEQLSSCAERGREGGREGGREEGRGGGREGERERERELTHNTTLYEPL